MITYHHTLDHKGGYNLTWTVIDIEVERYSLRTAIVQKDLALILTLFLFATYFLVASFLKKTVHPINICEE